MTAAQLTVLAGRAYSLSVLDGVHLDLSNPEEFARDCEQGVSWGMSGKTIIHPQQIEAANQAFRPSEEEVAMSIRMIAAHGEAAARGNGVALVDGKLVENLHVANAHRVLGEHDAIQRLAMLKY